MGVMITGAAQVAGCSGPHELAEATGAYRAALELGPEQELDAPVPVPAPEQLSPAAEVRPPVQLAYDVENDVYVAAWPDLRERFPSPAVNGFNPSVYMARIRSDGTLLDPEGIRVLPPESTPNSSPGRSIDEVACDDAGTCLLAGRRAPGFGGTYAVRVADGQLLIPHRSPSPGAERTRWSGMARPSASRPSTRTATSSSR